MVVEVKRMASKSVKGEKFEELGNDGEVVKSVWSTMATVVDVDDLNDGFKERHDDALYLGLIIYPQDAPAMQEACGAHSSTFSSVRVLESTRPVGSRDIFWSRCSKHHSASGPYAPCCPTIFDLRGLRSAM